MERKQNLLIAWKCERIHPSMRYFRTMYLCPWCKHDCLGLESTTVQCDGHRLQGLTLILHLLQVSNHFYLIGRQSVRPPDVCECHRQWFHSTPFRYRPSCRMSIVRRVRDHDDGTTNQWDTDNEFFFSRPTTSEFIFIFAWKQDLDRIFVSCPLPVTLRWTNELSTSRHV